jgi:lipoprotein-anchoring transpeptidase ErfK/SrfK
MARYHSRTDRRTRNRNYTILFLLFIVVAFAVYFRFFNDNKAGTEPIDVNTPVETNPVSALPPPNSATELLIPAEINQPPVAVQVMPVNEPIRQDVIPQQESPVITQTAPSAAPNAEVAKAIVQANALLTAQPPKIIEARDVLNSVIRIPMSIEQNSAVKSQLSTLSESWLFSRTLFPNDLLCERYQVKSGDNLESIGKKYNVPYEFLQTINSIPRANLLQAGQYIKVVKGPFTVKVFRSTFTMDIYLQNTYVRSFKISLGKLGSETPTGMWRVKAGGKLEKPVWTNPATGRLVQPDDSDYPLGSRWIALEGLDGQAEGQASYGIHGTKEEGLIGTAASMGCIRLQNGDAITVYNMLVPVSSLVEVTD